MNEEKGLLYNLTGDGKGKSSSAFGMALRALGWGWEVGILQFIKNENPTGERLFFEKYFPQVLFESRGLGFTVQPGDHADYARQAWARSVDLLQHFPGRLLILDELNIALSLGFLPESEVVAALQSRQAALNVIITGRGATPRLIEISDLVSEVCEIKHPYQKGVSARKGLDY